MKSDPRLKKSPGIQESRSELVYAPKKQESCAEETAQEREHWMKFEFEITQPMPEHVRQYARYGLYCQGCI